MSTFPFFWRFQLVGWGTYVILSFPLKWVIFASFGTAVFVTATRDVLVFALTCAMRAFYHSYCSDLRRIIRNLFASLVVSSLAGLILTGFSFVLYSGFGVQEEVSRALKSGFRTFYMHAGLCFCWSLLYFGVKSMMATIESEVCLARTEAKHHEAELQILKTQINSHFLFNALNTVLTAAEKQKEGVARMLQSLSDYLNYVLTHRNSDLVKLSEEYDALASYLVLEQARLGTELDITCSITPEAREALVPGILLQPLVENAIKYGRETWSPPVVVRLSITQERADILVNVFNTGRWISPDSDRVTGGIGLENVRRRLELLFPGQSSIDILPEDGWVAIQVRFPFRS